MRRILLRVVIVLIINAAAFQVVLAIKTGETRKTRPSGQARPGTDSVSSYSLLRFAQSLIGTPYRPATSDPLRGFDCSGFVSYVFKSFNFNVPRSSCDFINIGTKIKLEDARPGDIILFTGTKGNTRKIGHVGIVFCTDGSEMKFIHSTSGREHGVTITTMDANYRRRYVQVIRLIRMNNEG